MEVNDPDSVWLLRRPSYPPNPPTRRFEQQLELRLGNHTVRCILMPGHTRAQTSVFLPDEGVVLTGDNLFHRCKTIIQEANPWEWLAPIEAIRALGAEIVVPGHGEPCSNDYLAQQASIIEGWVGAVEDFVRRGMTADEAVAQPTPDVDPYPIGQRQFASTDGLNERIVRNLDARIVARNAA
jgi:glyoxylase-like metal-dependent hydrolase (beta-lactamase superfamily II)